MSVKFENAIIEEFSQLDFNNFVIDISKRHLFVCGGVVDATALTPPSFRDRLLAYTAKNEKDIHDAFVMAEKFKDYLTENTYTDLLMFEDDIASICSLVMILLETPGSLVELGMFCTKPEIYKKILIVAPEEETKAEDSFIYLGPLQYIKKKSATSVAIYPWPDNRKKEYDDANLIDLCGVIQDKLSAISKSEKFDIECSGHMSFLIYEIVRIGYPIIISEIEFALEAMDVGVSQGGIKRHLYLLNKLGYIDSIVYSTSYKYYYPLDSKEKRVRFGKAKAEHVVDTSKIRMSLMQSFVLSEDGLSRKRVNAYKVIARKMDGDG